MRRLLWPTACLAGLLAVGTARATVTGYVVENEPSNLNTLPDAYATTTNKAAEFSTDLIDFETSGGPGNNTAAGSDSPSTTIAEFVALTDATFSNFRNGFSTSDLVVNTDWVFIGSTYLHAGGNSFVVGHDDGVLLSFPGLGGLVVNQPQDTGLNETPFNVSAPSAGLYSFQLDYHENNTGPADIVFTINGAPVGVPEPASLAMLGVGLAALGLLRRRRNNA